MFSSQPLHNLLATSLRASSTHLGPVASRAALPSTRSYQHTPRIRPVIESSQPSNDSQVHPLVRSDLYLLLGSACSSGVMIDLDLPLLRSSPLLPSQRTASLRRGPLLLHQTRHQRTFLPPSSTSHSLRSSRPTFPPCSKPKPPGMTRNHSPPSRSKSNASTPPSSPSSAAHSPSKTKPSNSSTFARPRRPIGRRRRSSRLGWTKRVSR